MTIPTEQEQSPNQNNDVDAIRVRVDTVERIGLVSDEVISHVQNNLVKTTSESSICVDGGYQAFEAMGELARAGADLGLSMALMKEGLEPEQAFLAVYTFRVDRGQKYGWHSDTHVDPEDGSHTHAHDAISGCGHCNAAFRNAEKYGLSSEKVGQLLAIIKQYQAEHPENMRFINLNREHSELGILQVESEDITVLPWDKATGNQFFVYDATRDHKLIQELVTSMRETNPDLSEDFEDRLKQAVAEQTNTTLGLLDSSKGKPIYQVRYQKDKVFIERIGDAPNPD